MLPNKLAGYYIATFISILLNVIFVVVGFESLLHLLKELRSVDSGLLFFLTALLKVILEVPHKASEFLPLAIYTAFGLQTYFWNQKRQWLVALVMGMTPRHIDFLKGYLFCIVLIFSCLLCWFLGPLGYDLAHSTDKREVSSSNFDQRELKTLVEGDTFYKFLDQEETYLFDFTNQEFHRDSWRLSGQILYVGTNPIIDLEILTAEKRKFSGSDIIEKIHYSKVSPPFQYEKIQKSLLQSVLVPFCSVLALAAGWLMFPIHAYRRSKVKQRSFLLHVTICSFIFLVQHITASIYVLPLQNIFLYFIAGVISIFLLLLRFRNSNFS